ncbi:MAG: hypothetical protein A2749_00145 [Parcubacteria group bacterium RIFCSPHIGHO2_01_FULL_45_26]|nr:MAG: hypothetical protein A2749_00145 [Parcubacteria group bacterium RIFCSPHIGHO2_01_FULL_45_26]
MKINALDFGEGDKIPKEYTCDGEGVSPALVWEEVPDGTKSFALIVDDPDIPDIVKKRLGIEKFDHWVLYNIPIDCRAVPRGEKVGLGGFNSSGDTKYTGPCPPDREHRYFFKLYALDTLFDRGPGATSFKLEKLMSGHILATATLIACYERPK